MIEIKFCHNCRAFKPGVDECPDCGHDRIMYEEVRVDDDFFEGYVSDGGKNYTL